MAGNKLLVADDSVTIQKVIRLALAASSAPGSDRHYEIQSVSDGNELIRHLQHFIPDAILIDVSLPHKSAFEIKSAVEKMGAEFAGIRFILLVGSDERIEDSRLRELGFSGVLTKPFEPSHLRQVLADALLNPPVTMSAPSLPPGAPPAIELQAPDFVGDEEQEESLPPILPSLEAADPLPPPPLDFGELDAPPALPTATELLNAPEPPASEPNLWDAEEEKRLLNATRNIEIRLHAPEFEESEGRTPSLPLSSNPIEEDIRKLAETTLRMSGFQDASNESPLEPPSIFPEKDMPHSSSTATDEDTGWSVREPSRHPLKAPRATPSAFAEESRTPPPPETPGRGMPASPIDEPSVIPLSMDQMEQILERQLKATLQSMAERILPEIATKILKDEIHKMLTNDGP